MEQVTSKNGERVIELCEDNDLIIGGTLFTHRNIEKLIWTSPDGRSQSQIDHIIINSKWRGSLQYVRMMRNADVGSDNDMIVARMSLKLSNTKIGMARNQRPDISKSEGHSHQGKVYLHAQEPHQHPPRKNGLPH